jgi:Arc/MetJ family transcription regulator
MKHLVDVDDALLSEARVILGTKTIKDTVNEALRLAAQQRRADLNSAVDELAELVASLPITDRADAW